MTNPKYPGIFIALEGSEGCGKTTQRDFIVDYFKSREIEVVATREPGGTPMAEEIRDVLLRDRDERVDATTELLLFFAARCQHIEEVIIPALSRGAVVVCDRFIDTTYAYQFYGRDRIPFVHLLAVERVTTKGLLPNYVFLFDVPLEVGMARAAARGKLDRFEAEGPEFFQRVTNGYKQMAEQRAGLSRYIDVNGVGTREEVFSNIKPHLDDILLTHVHRNS